MLPNGNTEIGFTHAGGEHCRFYYEIDRGTRKIQCVRKFLLILAVALSGSCGANMTLAQSVRC
jgi:hypothetical protein